MAKKPRDLTWIDEGDEDERIVIKPSNEKKRIIVKKKGEPGEMMELDVMEYDPEIDVPQKGERVEVEIFII
ncbi:hypothetical protein GF337_08975 [candidate division KSB1 bacterium]|nr:hypothetical protein [candidate division KSB1 bacterium]